MNKNVLFLSAHLPSKDVPQAGQRIAFDNLQSYSSDYNIYLFSYINEAEKPFFDMDYDPDNMTTCTAIQEGIKRTKDTRKSLGPDFTRQVGENRTGVSMSKELREKRKAIYRRALQIVGQNAEEQ